MIVMIKRYWMLLLVWSDRVLNRVFEGGSESQHVVASVVRESHLLRLSGPRIGSFNSNGQFEIGGFIEVIHTFDEKGKIVGRCTRRSIFRKQGNIFYGDRAVYAQVRKDIRTRIV